MGKTYYHKYDKSNKKEADKKAKADGGAKGASKK